MGSEVGDLNNFYTAWAEVVDLADRLQQAFITTATSFESIGEAMSILGPYQIGQVHQLFETRAQKEVRSMVRLIGLHRDPATNPTNSGRRNWVIADVLTERKQIVGESYLSFDTFNEMEVLAWAAR